MKKLIKIAKLQKNKANKLLDKTGLIKILQKFGEVKIVGSYKYDLMTHGDIDIYLINPNPNKKLAVKVLNTLIEENRFTGYFFYDWVKNRDERFPVGYYVGLKTKMNNEKWKIDIWFLKKTVPELKGIDNLSDSQKETILKLKLDRDKKDLPISSYQIYQSVLKKDAANLNVTIKL